MFYNKEILSLVREVNDKISEIQKDVALNTRDLTEHKEGVKQNRARIEHLEKEYLRRLEAKKIKSDRQKLIFKILSLVLGAGGFCAAILTVVL